jgi:hypothetical protein
VGCAANTPVRLDDDPASSRYISAYGRDVDVGESQLQYDPATRHLTIGGGSRRDAAARDALDDMLRLLEDEPKLSGRQIETRLSESTEHRRDAIRGAIRLGIREASIVTEPGPRRSILHIVALTDEVSLGQDPVACS